MSTPPDVARRAAELRDLARRARRLSIHLSNEQDRQRLERYARELERQAAELETRDG